MLGSEARIKHRRGGSRVLRVFRPGQRGWEQPSGDARKRQSRNQGRGLVEGAGGGFPSQVSEKLQKWRAATQLAGRAGANIAVLPPALGVSRKVHSPLSEQYRPLAIG